MTATAVKRDQQASRSGAREQLLAATSALLTESDTLDISLNEISARAQLNHGLVKYYFGNKEGLLLALLDRDAGTALTALETLVGMSVPPLRKLELHIRGVINTYFRHPYINRLINYLQGSSDTNAVHLAKVFITPLLRFQHLMIEEAVAAGAIHPVKPEFFYFSIIGACDFPFNARRTLPHAFGMVAIGDEVKNSYADHVVRMVMGGIARN